MEAILPFKIKNEQKFFDCALKLGYNEMETLKFIYVMQQSDMDIFPIMHDERINMLLYGWELCEDYKQNLNPNEWELPEEMETVLKLLVPWSMDIWFSKEWDKCKYFLKTALIHCLNRARDLLMRMPDMMQINWDFLLLYNLKPWNVLYLKNLTVTKDKTLENGAQSIETEELPATDEAFYGNHLSFNVVLDIGYVKLEQLPIIVLRLVKFFDQSSIDMVKTLCMRVIAAWNKIHQTELETSGARRPYVPPEDKRCLLLICHIYLMAIYESDDVKGYVIDNMINNIRFYSQGFQNSTPLHVMDNFEYTPARYIALTNFHLRVQKRDFFDFFIWNKYDTSLVNLFGVVSQAYKSYLLGNLLMELNNMNEDDFAANIPLYKRLMNSYVNEREKSEIFLLNELTKQEHQRYAHNVIQTVKNITDCESKICKGNRMSNIGNYENSDDTVAPLADAKTKAVNSETKIEEIKEEVIDEDVELEEKRVRESELRLDPVFQNLPNNESMLYYVYDVLAKKDYKGWHFAKVVLLVKIIGHEQNMIETWRYHPGLTTDFMLNLEVKLSDHYVDLAKIFTDHAFLEQEFWLTAFYLNPTPELYEIIKRLGMRNNRKRTEEHTKLVMSIDNIEAKYGLLSSTIDVKELATMSNTDDPVTDYDPLFSALHSLKVPDSLIKDMLTAIFLPRNRSFAWSLDWVVLRNRCKMIMTCSKEKKRFVDLNMAEANERLKYLIIDYDKYKNRPQLDYGTIEQGYENLIAGGEFDKDSSEEEEEEEEDFEDDEDVYESKKRGRPRLSAASRKKEEEEKLEDENSQEDDPFLMGKRRTRARTAATLASFLFQTLPRSSRRKRNQKPDEEAKTEDEKISGDNDDRSSDSKSPITTSETPAATSPFTASCNPMENSDVHLPTKNLQQRLQERPTFLNTTQGFQNLIDIWNVEKTDLQSIDENCVSLMESSAALQIAVKLKLLNKEINPISCDDKEFIDDKNMLIHNAEYAIKLEGEVEEAEITSYLTEKVSPMDNCEENVESKRIESTSFESNIQQPAELPGEKDRRIDDVNPEDNIEIAAEGSFKLPDETTTEKVSEIRRRTNSANLSQDSSQAEENSSESLNSEMSTAARKNSGEVSEANSKRNSFNIDIEMVEKMETTELIDIIEKELEESSRKLVEIAYNDEETESGQDEKYDETAKTSDEKQPDDEGNRAKECNKDQKEKPSELENLENVNEILAAEGETSNQDKEIAVDGKRDQESATAAETRDVQGNKTVKSKNETWPENYTIKEQAKNDELKLEEKTEASEENKAKKISETEKEINSSSTETEKDEINIPEVLNIQTVAKKSEQLENKYTEIENESKATASKNNNSSAENEEKSIYTIQAIATSTGIANEISAENLFVVESEEQNDIVEISPLIDESPRGETEILGAELKEGAVKNDKPEENKISDNKLLGVESIVETGKNPDLKDRLEISENYSKIEGSEKDEIANVDTATCSELPTKIDESKLDLVATNDLLQEETFNLAKSPQMEKRLVSDEDCVSDDKVFLSHSEDQESDIILHLSSNEEKSETHSEKNENENPLEETAAEILEDQKKYDELIASKKVEDETKTKSIECEKAVAAPSYPTKTEIIDSTKAEEAPLNRTIFDTNETAPTEATEAKNYCTSPDILLDDTSSLEYQESTDSETRELKNLCLKKSVKVLLCKLRPDELVNLRQPKVKVQRTSYEQYLLASRPKRRRLEEKLYLEFDDSSNSNNSYAINSSSSEAYRPPTMMKRKIPVKRHAVRQARTSDSDNDSNNSEDMKLSAIMFKERKRRLSPPSTSQRSAAKRIAGPKSAQKRGRPKHTRPTTGPKSSKQNLVVTPRSASGLKLRISNADQRNQQVIGPMSKRTQEILESEVIQLSSASSDEFAWNELSTIQEEDIIVIDENPLFEEEIII